MTSNDSDTENSDQNSNPELHMPNPGAGMREQRQRKLAFTILPPGVSAEEAAKILKEFAEKHGHKDQPETK
jgi:hypothetical protein